MPTALRIGPYRFGFFSIDCSEPPHVHVFRENATAKVWLNGPVIEYVRDFIAVEARRILKIVADYRKQLLRNWNEHCGKKK